MTQYAVPTSDISKVNFVQGAGDGDGSAFDELDEGLMSATPDDATTYWTTDNVNNTTRTIECKLGPLTDPLTHTGHVIESRVGKDLTGGVTIAVNTHLYQGTTLIASSTDATVAAPAWNTNNYTLTEAQAAAITDYTDLRIRVVFTFPAGTSRRARISAMELAVPDVVTNAAIPVYMNQYRQRRS